VQVDGDTYHVLETTADAFNGIDIALFAGTEGEKGAAVTFGKEAIARGAVVIDNGNDFRMDPNVPLVVPEVNADALVPGKRLIANPNCSTIQMVVALKALYDISRIKRIVVSTYQAVSGTGRSAITELREQAGSLMNGEPCPEPKVYGKQIAFNCYPQIGSFREDGYTTEEWKMVAETHKILSDDKISINATTIRVPVFNSHSETVYVETEEKITREQALQAFKNAPGIILVDEPVPTAKDPNQRSFYTPVEATREEPVYISRVREDPFEKTGLAFWCVADNLWKGAALNAVQIAETVIQKGLI
jgi:aspartate-semialdehyde dehydrogenase